MKLVEYIKALKGITYDDWKKLRLAVDRVFGIKKDELDKDIKLADVTLVKDIIQSQFGQKLD